MRLCSVVGMNSTCFGRAIDNAIMGIAMVVTAGSGVRVIIGADPTGSIHRASQSSLDAELLLWFYLNLSLHQIEFRTSRDSDQVIARGDLLGEGTVVGLILVVAAVSSVNCPEFGRSGSPDAEELNFGG